MEAKELKGLSKKQLIELIGVQNEEIDSLNKQIEALNNDIIDVKKDIEQRDKIIGDFGTFSKSTTELVDIFRDAEIKAKDYIKTVSISHVQKLEELTKMEEDAQAKYQEVVNSAKARCEKMQQDTDAECQRILVETQEKCKQMENQSNDEYILKMARVILKNKDKYEALLKESD
ncbi:MAG: hypothetical protein Q4E33_04385 [Erysipelotrichaceae bacterium]|nr:hypothetical protein [Erysipelotrichaceae bacterium]